MNSELDPLATVSCQPIVYGAMSKIELLQIVLLYFNLFGYFASSNPSLPESSCRHFPPCMYGCHFEFKMADTGRFQAKFNALFLKTMGTCNDNPNTLSLNCQQSTNYQQVVYDYIMVLRRSHDF